MLGFVRALWAVFDRIVPWRRALVLGLAEQGANVLLPAGGAGGPAFGAYVMRRVGVPADYADQRHAALFLATSAVGFFALVLAGTGEAIGLLPGDVSLAASLLPAVGAAAMIVLAVVYARLPPTPEPSGGRARVALWRLRRFLHDCGAHDGRPAAATATACSCSARSPTTPSTSRASRARSRPSAAGRPRSASSSSPTPSGTRARCCRRRAASAGPRAA